MGDGGDGRNREPVHQPSAAHTGDRDRRRDERRAGDGDRGGAAVRGDHPGRLAEHHEPGRGREKEHERQRPEDGPTPLVLFRGRHRRAGRERDAGARDQPRADQARHPEDRGERAESGADTERANAPSEKGSRDHGARGIQTHEVPIHQAMVSRDGEVHDLLREDIGGAAPGAEAQAVAHRELEQVACRRRQRDAEHGRRRADEHQNGRGSKTVDVGREVCAARESRGGEREDERELGAAQSEERLERLQEHAERVERAERKIEHSGGGNRAPRARPRRSVDDGATWPGGGRDCRSGGSGGGLARRGRRSPR